MAHFNHNNDEKFNVIIDTLDLTPKIDHKVSLPSSNTKSRYQIL